MRIFVNKHIYKHVYDIRHNHIYVFSNKNNNIYENVYNYEYEFKHNYMFDNIFNNVNMHKHKHNNHFKNIININNVNIIVNNYVINYDYDIIYKNECTNNYVINIDNNNKNDYENIIVIIIASNIVIVYSEKAIGSVFPLNKACLRATSSSSPITSLKKGDGWKVLLPLGWNTGRLICISFMALLLAT